MDELDKIINEINSLVDNKENIIILLRGDLASGKTTLVKEFVKSVGIKEQVTSPTFSLQSCYGENIYHYDIYNKSLEDFISLGLLEEFEKDGIHFVEWGDGKLENILTDHGFDTAVIEIEKLDDKRSYCVKS